MTKSPLRILGTTFTAFLATACMAEVTEAETPARATSTDASALAMALDDEYRAEAMYEAVIALHGEVRPFSNIIMAEQRHSQRVREEMDRLGIPHQADNPFLGEISAPSSLLEACEQGAQAEIENIALYDEILPTIGDVQVRATLSDLQWASKERHLPAFQQCVERGGKPGIGQGHNGHRGRQN